MTVIAGFLLTTSVYSTEKTSTACKFSSSEASYNVYSRYKYVGKLYRSLRVTKDSFHFTSLLKTGFFWKTNHSKYTVRGKFYDGSAEPEFFSELSPGLQQRWWFKPEQKMVVGEMNQHKIRQTHGNWPILDRESILLNLRCELLAGNLQRHVYRVFDRGQLYQYDAELLAKHKTISTVLGGLDTAEVRVLVDPGHILQLLWFSYKYGGVLVQSTTLETGARTSFFSIQEFHDQSAP